MAGAGVYEKEAQMRLLNENWLLDEDSNLEPSG